MALQQTSIGYHNNDQYPHFYLCNYLPGSVGRDTFSNSLLKFKRGEHPDLEGWIDCTLEESAGLPIREDTVILRALHHHEPIASPSRPASLDLLGKALATRFKCRYLPGLLHKSRPVEEIKKLTREQRVIALHEAYRFSIPPPSLPPNSSPDHPDNQNAHHNDPNHYLVLDDIVTTGSTMNAIIEAILREYTHPPASSPDSTSSPTSPPPPTPLSTPPSTPPSSLPATPFSDLPHALPSILTFSLAKADYDASFNLFHHLQGRHYRLEQGARWLLAEEEEPYKPYYSSVTLKNWIREDSFPPASPP